MRTNTQKQIAVQTLHFAHGEGTVVQKTFFKKTKPHLHHHRGRKGQLQWPLEPSSERGTGLGLAKTSHFLFLPFIHRACLI
jgi:hypothetical protein